MTFILGVLVQYRKSKGSASCRPLLKIVYSNIVSSSDHPVIKGELVRDPYESREPCLHNVPRSKRRRKIEKSSLKNFTFIGIGLSKMMRARG